MKSTAVYLVLACAVVALGMGGCGSSDQAPPDAEVSLETTEALDELQAMVDDPQLFSDELARSLQTRLHQKLASDPVASRQILDVFLQAPNSAMGQMLGAVMGRVKDANIETAAMQLASSGASADDRIAGLSLLQRLDIDNPETRQVVLDTIDSAADTRVLHAALYALKPAVVSQQESQQVLNTLQRHLASADAETRRRSVIAYADWAGNAQEAMPIVDALFDYSVAVRAGAAFALGRSGHRSVEIRDALIQKVEDRAENWEVRNQARIAVQGFESE